MAHIYAIDGIVPVVHSKAFISPTATLIGDVIVGEACYIGPSACLRGDLGRIVMLAGSNVQDACVVHGDSRHDTTIGNSAIVSHGAILHGCEIGSNALIGMNSIVMDGAVIGEQAFVAAMSLVKRGFTVPPGTLVMGIPARVRRRITPHEVAFLKTGARVYRDLALRQLSTTRASTPLRRLTPRRLAQRISAARGHE